MWKDNDVLCIGRLFVISNHGSNASTSKCVLIALGSEGRGDDGVGLLVARQLTGKLPDCRIISGQDDCMAIVNALEDVDIAVVVDAANSGAKPGTIHRLVLGDKPVPRELARCSSHGTGLAEAIDIATILNRLPEQLIIYAIEAQSFTPGDTMTPAVERAANEVACCIEQELLRLGTSQAVEPNAPVRQEVRQDVMQEENDANHSKNGVKHHA